MDSEAETKLERNRKKGLKWKENGRCSVACFCRLSPAFAPRERLSAAPPRRAVQRHPDLQLLFTFLHSRQAKGEILMILLNKTTLSSVKCQNAITTIYLRPSEIRNPTCNFCKCDDLAVLISGVALSILFVFFCFFFSWHTKWRG